MKKAKANFGDLINQSLEVKVENNVFYHKNSFCEWVRFDIEREIIEDGNYILTYKFKKVKNENKKNN